MDSGEPFPSAILKQGLDLLSIPYTQEQITQCEIFFFQYREYSTKINLSTIKDPEEFVIKHVLDSLSGYAFLSKNTQNIADLGSGGGFPGIILALFMPHLSFTLIDVIQKKVNYLRQIIAILKLPYVRVFNASQEKVEGSFDIIVTRALGSLSKILLYAKPYLSSRTKILAYKAKLDSIQKELQSISPSFQTTVVTTPIPFLEAERHMVLLQKK